MSIEEEQFIKRAKIGDSKSFGQLVTKYQKRAFNLAFRIVCDEDDAQDVVQESFIKIWKNMKMYNQNIKFSTWMHTIVTNTAIDLQRSNSKKSLIDIDNVEINVRQLVDNPEDEMDNKELGSLIKLASNELTPKQRIVFVLRDLQGLKSEEVSEILKLSANSIKSNLYHARKAIKEKLQHILMF